MGLLDKIHIPGLFSDKKSLSGGISGGPGRSFGGDELGNPGGGALGGSGSRGVKFNDEDGTGPLNISLRTLQTLLPFVNLCIFISIASFQRKYSLGPTFMTWVALIFNIQSLIIGAIFLGTPLLYESVSFLRGLARGLRQIRIAVIVNGTQVFFMLILAISASVSANSSQCKNPAEVSNKDAVGGMGGYCRNKRAGAAFFWLNFFAWLATLGLILYVWYTVRKNPQSTGFAIPGSHFPQDDDEEAFAHSDAETPRNGGGNAGYRPSGDYYGGEVFGESAQGYGAAGRGESYGNRDDERAREEEYHHPVTRDPFEDQGQDDGRQTAYERGYEENDPYEVIRKSMDVQRPSY